MAIPIAATAEACLQTSPYSSIRRITCVCEEGKLILRGRLSTFFEKQLAQEAVADIQGVTQVVNQIEVSVRTT